ncbi:small glutamine-rich tetratricopeptide repeat-containing protein alpha-like [Odontomachus brunneus]|uniref:small glutamine-rich tetratricopeptide repeat-containing protein alpha-like n=1 Tax=Odontomachus brunneus TaxID=486640 RepID=UPI0013F29F3D|nr:small glutamine-rich tetratricopeptide repeat-containing protein alpha-like [Odontomachus brunneus]XP_032684411.1 small glutamine-rich tetratricopeptide repeat-containing protein alpha-like [Odontomachus brunneus]XP_032684418.1 small glutamine-rich tetratricopeptide repeat-containing protein alpha-like [Odontomachus brunneus]
MAVKGLVAAIVQFLTDQLQNGDMTADSRESLEVAIQCLESAYNVQASDTPNNFNLYNVYKNTVENVELGPEATSEAKAEAERLKNEGNALMKAEKHQEALANYTKAIELDGRNAVYYCNRAAVHSKLGNHTLAIKDCHTALAIDPSYSKAYGRLGLAYSGLDKHKEAKESYEKALAMEPDNESYRNNLQLTEEKLAHLGVNQALVGGLPGMDLSALLSNQALMNMARQMLSDPAMQNMMCNLMAGNVEEGGRMGALIEVGQQLAQQMQNANPELIESLRRQMGGNPNDPDPSQQN